MLKDHPFYAIISARYAELHPSKTRTKKHIPTRLMERKYGKTPFYEGFGF